MAAPNDRTAGNSDSRAASEKTTSAASAKTAADQGTLDFQVGPAQEGDGATVDFSAPTAAFHARPTRAEAPAPTDPSRTVDFSANVTTPGEVADGGRTVDFPTRRGDDRTLAHESTTGAVAGHVKLNTLGRSNRSNKPDATRRDDFTRYTVTRLHAEGGLGKVWVANDDDLNREVVLKELRPSQATRPDSMRRFLKEAQITGQLEHPNIVPIYELGWRPKDGQPFYTMRFVRGDTLSDAIAAYHQRRRQGRDDPLELRKLLAAFVSISNALGYAHSRGVIHRDLKPANVALGEFGEVIVLDWGIAKLMGQSDEMTERGAVAVTDNANLDATLDGSVMGTPGYMAPEQADGRIADIDPRTDIYGLGAILFEILTGEAPHRGHNTMEVLDHIRSGKVPTARFINPSAPRALSAICSKAMALRSEDRYDSALTLASDVERWLADEPVSAFPEPWWDRSLRWMRKHRAQVLAAGACLLVLLASTAAWSRYERARVERVAAQAGQLLRSGQAALDANDLERARTDLSQALGQVSAEPRLPELADDARRLLARVDARAAELSARDKTRRDYDRFARLRDEALFHGTLFTGIDVAENQRAARRSADEALALFPATTDADGQLHFAGEQYLSTEERESLRRAEYELLLVAAESDAAAPEAEIVVEANTDEVTAAPAKLALARLDRAKALKLETRAWHERRAKYLAQADEDEAADNERAIAERTPLAGAMDEFLVGDEAYKRGDTTAAVAHFDQALRQEPNHFWAHYFLAVCDLKQGRPREAIAHLTASLGARPDFGWTYLLRGYAYADLGEFATAEQDFATAEGLGVNDYGFFVNRGALRIKQQRHDEAAADLRHAIELRPDQYQAYVNLAELHRRRQEYDQALPLLDKAAQLARDVATPYRIRAQILADQGELQAAVGDFNRAIRFGDPMSQSMADDYVSLGRALRQLDRHEDALAAYDAALAIDPERTEVERLRAAVLILLGRGQDALAAFDDYLEPEHVDADAFQQRGFERLRLGDQAGALADLTRAIELQPEAPLARARRGWAYVNSAARLALADFESALAAEPDNADFLNGRGYARVLLGEYQPAVADAEAAIAHVPQAAPLNERLAIIVNAACVHAQAAGRARADDATRDHDALAASYEARAIELLRQAAALVPPAARSAILKQSAADAAFDPIRHSQAFTTLLEEHP